MKIKSLIKKIIIMSSLKLKLSKYKIYGNLYYIGNPLKLPKKILFYFPFYEFMHYGDHLFFEPLIRFMLKSGFEVVVCPVDRMMFYFESLGYKVTRSEDCNFDYFDLTISKVELYYLSKNFNNRLLIKTNYPKTNAPLCQDMVNKVASFLGIQPLNMGKYAPLHVNSDDVCRLETKLLFDKNKKYIILNTYIDSGSYSVREFHKNKILKFAETYIKENIGYEILLVGTNTDKIHDKLKYNFECVDLRGTTSIYELFILMQSNLVDCYIGFDTLLMHLANMYEKKSYIFVRKSIVLMWRKNLMAVLLPYVTDKVFLKKIDY